MTFAQVLVDIAKQLAWKGPNGKTMGHIVLSRDKVEVLLDGLAKLGAGDEAQAKD